MVTQKIHTHQPGSGLSYSSMPSWAWGSSRSRSASLMGRSLPCRRRTRLVLEGQKAGALEVLPVAPEKRGHHDREKGGPEQHQAGFGEELQPETAHHVGEAHVTASAPDGVGAAVGLRRGA